MHKKKKKTPNKFHPHYPLVNVYKKLWLKSPFFMGRSTIHLEDGILFRDGLRGKDVQSSVINRKSMGIDG